MLFVLLIAAAGIYYYFFYSFMVRNNAWRYVPYNAGLIIQIDKPQDFLSKFGKDSKIRESLCQNVELKKLITRIETADSMYGTNRQLSQLINAPCLVSAFYDAEGKKTQWLFIVQAATNIRIEALKANLKKYHRVNYIDKQLKIIVINHDSLTPDIYLGVKDNILLFSTGPGVIKKSIATAQSIAPHFVEDKSFIHLREIAGKNVDARLFVRYSQLIKLCSPWLSGAGREAFRRIGNIAQWGETDVLVKDDELLMNGFSYTTPGNYLSGFSGSKQEDIRVFNILPFNTNFLIDQWCENIRVLAGDQKLTSFDKTLKPLLNKLLDVCGPESAFASNATGKSSVSANSWFLLRLKDPARARQYLKKIAKTMQTTSREIYNGHLIENAGVKNLIPRLFNPAFSTIENSWYTTLDDFIVFGNSSGSITNLLRFYESGKTLDMDENFNQFSDNLWDASNLLLYISPKSLNASLLNYLNEPVINTLNKNENILHNILGASFQFSATDSLFYTSFYFRVNESMKEGNLALWKIQLDDDIAGKPYLVKDHKTNTYNIIIFDVRSNIYLISSDGRLLWKKRLDALPLSRIYQVDYYKNGKIQYLFNTKDFIYLIDKNGNPVTGYPRKLNPSATNGISVFDYNGKEDYRILVAQSDKKVHNYQLNGKPVKGWTMPRMKNIVTEPIIRLLAGNKDYIIITDKNNNISIVNRKGQTRIKLKENPGKAKNSTYYVNKTNNKGIILTTDKNGRLVYISKNGIVKKTDFGNFSPNHYFLYEDFNGNRNKDFIYVDSNKLVVINRFKDVLFRYSFPSAINIRPVFFRLGKWQHVLGIVDSKEKTVFLFDKKGNPLIGAGLVGENPFTVGSLNNDGEINLITSSGKTLFNYKVD